MISLAVKYRPKTLDEVIGQDEVIKVLKRQIACGSVKNAYLFCGKSGNGKTTTARSFIRELNGGIGSPIEIDAASNNGVENVRQITQEASERSISSKYKAIIIDEAHALSNAAWQAFLKSIEETPEYTIYIFCTTDPQKIPVTILNRVQRFNFNKIPYKLIVDRLNFVCKEEGFTNYEEVTSYIGKTCGGCMREALTLLGKVADSGDSFNIDNAIKVLGDIPYNNYFNLINSFIDGDEKTVLKVLDNIEDSGTDIRIFIKNLLRFTVDVSKFILFGDCSLTAIPETYEKEVKSITNFENPITYYRYLMDKLVELNSILVGDSDPSTTARVICLQIARMS